MKEFIKTMYSIAAIFFSGGNVKAQKSIIQLNYKVGVEVNTKYYKFVLDLGMTGNSKICKRA